MVKSLLQTIMRENDCFVKLKPQVIQMQRDFLLSIFWTVRG